MIKKNDQPSFSGLLYHSCTLMQTCEMIQKKIENIMNAQNATSRKLVLGMLNEKIVTFPKCHRLHV
jgi:hypothetical protein